MRIFKTKHFSKWAKKNLVKDALLKLAAQEISENLFEADLGGNVLKKRIATKGRGKSRSIRTIVVFKKSNNCFFIYGFDKNEQSNINGSEEKALKIVAKELLKFSEATLKSHVNTGKLLEISNE